MFKDIRLSRYFSIPNSYVNSETHVAKFAFNCIYALQCLDFMIPKTVASDVLNYVKIHM